MKRSAPPPDPRFYPVLLRYSRGEVSAYDAACDIQDLRVPGFEDPSASEVVLWAKMAGFGIPTPSEEEARAEAEAILARSSGTGLIDNVPHTRVAPSPIHGRGLFAEIDFRAGQILGVLDGQVIRHAEHPDAFDQEWNAISTELLLVRAYPTKYRYINHAWTPNSRIEERDTTVRAVRDIAAGEELTLDYTAQLLPPEYLALERTAFLRRGAGSR